MRYQIVIATALCLVLSSCSKTSDVEPPSVSSITTIEYYRFEMFRMYTITVTRDTVKVKQDIMDSFGKWTKRDTAIQSNDYFSSLLSTIPLKEFWNMTDIPQGNLSGDSHARFTITASSEQQPTATATQSKKVTSWTGSFGGSMSATEAKIDSMVTLLVRRR